MSIGEMVAEAWSKVLGEMEDPFAACDYWGGNKRTYREHLDRRRINYEGKVIPQRAIVERNIVRLGRPLKVPLLP